MTDRVNIAGEDYIRIIVKEVHDEEGYLLVEAVEDGTLYTISMHDAITYGIKADHIEEVQQEAERNASN